jgi:hypothetical protein
VIEDLLNELAELKGQPEGQANHRYSGKRSKSTPNDTSRITHPAYDDHVSDYEPPGDTHVVSQTKKSPEPTQYINTG